MIDHVVLLRWKPDASSSARTKATMGIAALAAKLPGIMRYKSRAQASPEDKGHG